MFFTDFFNGYIHAILMLGTPELIDCPQCDCMHPEDFDGDCRDDAMRRSCEWEREDIAPEAMETMRRECCSFFDLHSEDLAQQGGDEQNGIDFFLTRNRHGAGFWDRGTDRVGERLTDAAHTYGEQQLYVGDDGKLYL